ncbi:hypothetical protein [Maricaulis sp.]|uniref:hypothetical protein n=1 Tax=Maricaulis sp. TaxID=1486257 RepID=UPI003A8D922B
MFIVAIGSSSPPKAWHNLTKIANLCWNTRRQPPIISMPTPRWKVQLALFHDPAAHLRTPTHTLLAEMSPHPVFQVKGRMAAASRFTLELENRIRPAG